MPIRLLPPDVVSKIAAGEVVERPASVVKELIENSLDAGASQIGIEVRGGGGNFIRVADNGTGIPKDEVELAFQRHATSKIATLNDLEKITTLGFRGEALHSIAHVAQVELLTRTKEESAGTWVSLSNGEIIDQGVRAAPAGTTIVVRYLFRNVPARLKFLKSATTEGNQITNLVTHYALAFPNVKFILSIDGREILHTSGSGRLRDVIAEAYGLEVAQAMLEIKGIPSDGGMTPVISGYTSPPSLSRASRAYLSFFVNGRWVQSRLLASAVEKAYEGWLMVGRFPISIINISIAPQFVDVNVHPTKREVRFAQEPLVFNALHGVIRRALSEMAPIPQIGLITPAFRSTSPRDMSVLPTVEKRPSSITPPIPKPIHPGLPILRVLGQASLTYIIAEGPDGLYLIDQHAAHERVLFDKILSQQLQKAVDIQPLLEPLVVELSLKQEETLRTGGDLLAKFGFDIEPFGDRTYLVRAVPAMLVGKDIAEAVKESIDSLDEETAGARRGERVARSLACHGAVRAGQVLSQDEMRELVRQLERATSPHTCPHGRPTMIHLSASQLDREFGRA